MRVSRTVMAASLSAARPGGRRAGDRGHRRVAPVECFEVTGGTALRGRVRVTGAKNSALKLMAAALLAPGRTTLDEVPDILDVAIMSEVLRRLRCGVGHPRPPGRGGGGGGAPPAAPEPPPPAA